MKGTDFFNILLPASRVSRTLKDIDSILQTDDIEKRFEKKELEAELFVFEEAEKTEPLTVSFIQQISKILFIKSATWAGKLRTSTGEILSVVGEYTPVEYKEIKANLEALIVEIVDLWEDALKDKDLQFWVLAYAYYNILRIRPFFDGNEKVAKLFMNYLAVKLGLPPINIAPKKGTKGYEAYIIDIRFADDGDLDPVIFRVKKGIRTFNIQEHFEELSAPATVLEAEIEGDFFYD